MDFFDERVLAALKDGKPISFTSLLGEVGFSHNTLQQHLGRLVARGLVVKEKMVSNSLGRPKFAYHVPSTATKQVTTALQNPYETLVTLPFTRLRHLCRFEKGGYCKETRKSCAPQNCPQTRKQEL
jgi:predicted ArsR family transcriptional regulator